MIGVKDIAERAGVSMITVSRVINTPQKVAAITRDRILAIMKEMGYVHNTAAHNLASGRSGIICIHISPKMDMYDFFVQQFLVGVSMELSSRGYSIQLVDSINPQQFCDGYIFTVYDPFSSDLEKALSLGKPVAVSGMVEGINADVIATDNAAGAKKITAHLISSGHRRIACILNDTEGDYVSCRLDGYRAALAEAGLAYDASLVHTVPNSSSGGDAAAEWYMSLEERPSAVFLVSDLMATGFISGVEKRGLKVPEDVSVAGFDGLGTHLISTPHITTIVQPIYEIARSLAVCMTERIADPARPYISRRIEGELLTEGSVAVIR